jgi:hypothetical protein
LSNYGTGYFASNLTIAAGGINVTGTTTTGGINNTSGSMSNIGTLCNSGLATFSGNINMNGGTISNIANVTGTYISVTGTGISNIANGAPLYLQTNSSYPIKVYSTGGLDLYAGWNGSPGLIACNVNINAGNDISATAVNNIQTTAVSTINTVPNTVFTGKVTAGSAMIGIPSAFGNTFAYFGHKDLLLTGYDYALLSENIGHTFLNAKSGQTIYFRNGNADIMTLNSSALNFASGKYINNLGHIYGDTSVGGLVIDYMSGMIFNSPTRNASITIDSANLLIRNFSTGIYINNQNTTGTGNLTLYSESNEIYIGNGLGFGLTVNSGCNISLNAANRGGGINLYASTINATSLLDTNWTTNGNYNFTGGGSSKYVTFTNAGTSIQFAGPNIYVGTATGGFSFNIPVAFGSAYYLNMQGAPICNVCNIVHYWLTVPVES